MEHLRALERELGIPVRDRQELRWHLARLATNGATNARTRAVVATHVALLLRHRDNVVRALRAIAERERLVSAGEDAVAASRLVCEAIAAWRRELTRPHPFVYRGRAYLEVEEEATSSARRGEFLLREWCATDDRASRLPLHLPIPRIEHTGLRLRHRATKPSTTRRKRRRRRKREPRTKMVLEEVEALCYGLVHEVFHRAVASARVEAAAPFRPLCSRPPRSVIHEAPAAPCAEIFDSLTRDELALMETNATDDLAI